MGKKSKGRSASSKTSSSINVNGSPYVVTNSSKKGSQTVVNYTPEQAQLNGYITNALSEAIPKLNTFLPETITAMDSEIDAYTKKGVQLLNDIYNPMIKNTQNNIAARFGNLDNSMFLDSLNSIESQRANAAGDLAQDIQAKRSELESNELAKQYNYVNFLNSYQNQQLQNMLNLTNTNVSAHNANNNYQYQVANQNNTNSSSSAMNYQTMLNMMAQLAKYMG